MGLSPGSAAVKQKIACPALFVEDEPPAGVAKVACAPRTLKTTVMPEAGLPRTSLTVAVTQCCAPTIFVAAAGVRTRVFGAPASQVLAAVPGGSPMSWVPLLLVSANAVMASTPAAVPV